MRARSLRVPAAAALLVGLGLVAGMPAASAATGSPGAAISNIEAAGKTLNFVFEATASESPLDQESVTVAVNNTAVDATAVPVGDAAGAAAVQRTTMLVMDTSGSMVIPDDSKLRGAKQAANAFITSVPDDLRVGLITFDDRARVVVQPTTDKAALSQAVNGLQADGSTAIYDAVVLAATRLGTTGIRNVVLVTDGQNDGSEKTLAQARKAIRDRKIRLDAVSFQTQEGKAALQALATAGRGNVFDANSTATLTKQFEQAAQRLSGQLLVSFPITSTTPTGQVTLTASGTAGGTEVSDRAVFLIPATAISASPKNAAPQTVQAVSGPFASDTVVWVAIGLFFVGLCGLLAFTLNIAVPGDKKSVKKQLSVYTLSNKHPKEKARETTAFGDSAVVHSAVDFAGRVVAKRGLEERLQRRLDAGAVPLKPAEWILIHVAAVVVVPLMMFLLFGNVVITLVALAAAVIGPLMYLSLKESRRRTKFMDQLPETLQVMAGSLSAGYSLPQAADTVVREGADPVASEFNRALIETRLGVPIEDALEAIAERMRSEDWAWVVMAIRVQREVGGNLAELLLTVAETLRERARLRRQVKVLSAEGRLSAWILGSLPVVFALYLLAARPSYIMTLGQEVLGWIMIVVGVVLLTVGGLWMKKVVDVEV